MSTERHIINDLQDIVDSIVAFQKKYIEEDEPCDCAGIDEAREKLQIALFANKDSYSESLRDARADRETRRAENGYPE